MRSTRSVPSRTLRPAASVAAIVATVLTFCVALLGDAAPSGADTTGPGAVQQPTTSMATADALPTVQIDGVAWKQVVVGNTVYVGGRFNNARPAGSPAGTNESPRTGLLAYDITTGDLLPFNHTLNGQVYNLAVSPDGSTLYAVGDFTTVDGLNRNRIAAFSTATGNLVTTFNPNIDSTLYAVVATNTTVYVGGLFANANGVPRSRLAAFDTAGNLTAWAPAADYKVNDMVLSPSGTKVVIAGAFTTLNGRNVYGFGAVDAVTGASVPWAANQTVQSYGTAAAFTSLSTDGTAIYATSYNFHGTGNIEGTVSVDPESGAVNWLEDCHGDTYDSFPVNGAVYTVGHPHYCGNLNGWPDYMPRQWRRTVAFTQQVTGTLPHDTTGYPDHYGLPSPSIYNWFPDLTTGTVTGQGQAAWTVSGNAQYIVEGGEFPSVNGVGQQGLVRFANRSVVTRPRSGPRASGTAFTPSVTNDGPGALRIAIQSNWDRDSQVLNYSIVRNGTTTVWTGSVTSHWWSRPMLGVVDTGLPTGTPVSYTVTVTDPDGNTYTSPAVSATPGTAPATTSFDNAILADNPTNYWPLSEASGTTVYDAAGFDDLDAGPGVTRGASGPFTGEAASGFSGSSNGNGLVLSRSSFPAPNTVTVSAWVKTTTTSGGRIVGLGNNPTSVSTTGDRMLYLDNSGKVYFGILNSAFGKITVASGSAVNDGSWHQVVGTYGNNTMTLWVDGVQVAQRSDVAPAVPGYNGWWRIGGDGLSGWTNAPSSNYLNGSIGSVAVFPSVLTRAQVQNEYRASGRTLTVPGAPSDSFGQTVYADDPQFYYRLDETSGTTAASAGAYPNPGKYSGGVTFRQPSTVTPNGTGVLFNGSTGTLSSTKAVANPLQYSAEAWFNTTTTKGGKIIGFGTSQTGTSSKSDRHVYMLNSGQLVFGTLNGSSRVTITTPNDYNDGDWHQVVATQGTDGMKLYVDGQLVVSNASTAAGNYTGFWRIGGDGSPWAGTSGYLNGELDEVSEYSYVLTPYRVAAHYRASPLSSNLPPSASFTVTQDGATATFNASGSADYDGSISSYSWDFGDQTSGTGVNPSHTYGSSGNYVVTLTVTDNSGASSSTQQTVAVATTPAGTVSATASGTPSGGKYAQIAISASYRGLTPNANCTVSVGGDDASQNTERASITGTTDSEGSLDVSGSAANSLGGGYVWNVGQTYFWSLSCGGVTGSLVLSPSSTSNAVPGAFVSLPPSRLLDTRTGTGGLRPGGHTAVSLQVTGRGGVPSSGVSAVVLNVTVTAPTAPGYITAYASGAPRPSASNLNFLKGQTVPNLVIAPVGSGGKVDLYNGAAGSVQLVADVAGYYLSGNPVDAGAFVSLAPSRLLDTRSNLGGARPGAKGTVALQVTGRGGVPSTGVAAVVLNVTVTQPAAPGFVTVYGHGATRPSASNLNFLKGQTVPNLVIAPVGTQGKVDLYNGSAGSAQLVADVAGYYLSGTPTDTGAFVSLAPARLLDTRTGNGGTRPAAKGTVALQVTGRGGVPTSGVAAVVLNVTVTQPVAPGYITVFGHGATRPSASNLNFLKGQTVPNLVVAPVSADGRVDLYNGSAGTVQLVADVAGYYLK